MIEAALRIFGLLLICLIVLSPVYIPYLVINSLIKYRRKRDKGVKLLGIFLWVIPIFTMGLLAWGLYELNKPPEYNQKGSFRVAINKRDTLSLVGYDMYPTLNPDGLLFRKVEIKYKGKTSEVEIHNSVNNYSKMNFRVVRVNDKATYILFEDQFDFTVYNLTTGSLVEIKGDPKPELYLTPGSVPYGEDRVLRNSELRIHLDLDKKAKIELLFHEKFNWRR